MTLWNVGGGSADAVFGVSIYGQRDRDAWWFKYGIMPVYRIGRMLSDLRYGIRSRLDPKYQHHIIRTGLEPGWHDCDTIMLHGCFALLKRYVEWEMGGAEKIDSFTADLRQNPDPNAPPEWQSGQADQSEAVILYRWWTVTKPADEAEYQRMLGHLYGRKRSVKADANGNQVWSADEPWNDADRAMHQQFRELEEKIAREEQEMLHRLIDIRTSLWT